MFDTNVSWVSEVKQKGIGLGSMQAQLADETTMAFDYSSLRCFEACFCKPTPRGHTLISCAASRRTTTNLFQELSDHQNL
jgi:hypothetical protein